MRVRVEDYEVFLFDFDGLLVDTEPYHHLAFVYACDLFGFSCDLDFSTYYQLVSKGRLFLKEYLIKRFPSSVSVWDALYLKKEERYWELLKKTPSLMPGVHSLLENIDRSDKVSVLVTNSSRCFVDQVIEDHPILQKIAFHIVREDYERPKPCPDAYLLAYNRYVSSGNRVVGFEDSEKGIQALSAIACDMVYVNRYHDLIDTHSFNEKKFYRLRSLEEVIW